MPTPATARFSRGALLWSNFGITYGWIFILLFFVTPWVFKTKRTQWLVTVAGPLIPAGLQYQQNSAELDIQVSRGMRSS